MPKHMARPTWRTQSGVAGTPEQLLQRMIGEVNTFVGTTPQHDDITCMVIKAG